MFVIHGKQHTLSGGIDVPFYVCPFCNKMNSTSVYLRSWYYHIFWIPLMPVEREGMAKCECGSTRVESQFGPTLSEEYKLIQKQLKHPWWTYMILVLFLLLIAAIIIAASL